MQGPRAMNRIHQQCKRNQLMRVQEQDSRNKLVGEIADWPSSCKWQTDMTIDLYHRCDDCRVPQTSIDTLLTMISQPCQQQGQCLAMQSSAMHPTAIPEPQPTSINYFTSNGVPISLASSSVIPCACIVAGKVAYSHRAVITRMARSCKGR